jgi:hypothetical protein
MARDNFWEDVEEAQEVLKRRAQLQAPVDRWQKLLAQVEEAVSLLDLAEEAVDAEVLQEVQVETSKLALEIEHFELESLLCGEMDTANAILSIHPGAGGTESQDWAHMLRVDHDVAEGGLHTPQAKHRVTVDGIFALDAFKQSCMLAGTLPAGSHTPVGNAPIEILPNLLAEFRLGPVKRVDRGVGFDIAHHPSVRRIGYATGARTRTKAFDPLTKRRPCHLCPQRDRRGKGRGRNKTSQDRPTQHQRRHSLLPAFSPPAASVCLTKARG